MKTNEMMQDRIAGVLLGTAVGDALGLPYEGLSRRRAGRLLSGGLRHRFLFGHGMVSDDTEHTDMVAQSLLDESLPRIDHTVQICTDGGSNIPVSFFSETFDKCPFPLYHQESRRNGHERPIQH